MLGAEGTALYGELKRAQALRCPGLFGFGGDYQMTRLVEAVKLMGRHTILMLNATPDDLQWIRVDKEAALLEQQLEMVRHRERDLHVVTKFAVRLDQVLHACYSKDIARAFARHVRYVVGSKDAIDDNTVPFFTYAFYQGLANGRPYETTFKMGRAEVAAINPQEAERYELFAR